VGVVNDFRSSIAEKTEVVWVAAAAIPTVSQLILENHVTGDTVRATVQSADLDRVLEKLREQHARLISVTPVQRTLEEYFLAKTREEEKEVVPK